jgi:hypothetical protein
MFEDFSFDAAGTRRRTSSPSPAISEYAIDPRRRWLSSRRSPFNRYGSSFQSECVSPLSRSSKPVVPSVADLIDHLRQHSLLSETPTKDEWRSLVIPSSPADEIMGGGVEADENFDRDEEAAHRASMNRRRYQRQATTRLMVEESHISSLEKLVGDMIWKGEQCSISRTHSPASSERASTPSLTSESSEDNEMRPERSQSTSALDKPQPVDRPPVEFMPSEALTMSWQKYARRNCVTKNVTILRNRRIRGLGRGVRSRV